MKVWIEVIRKWPSDEYELYPRRWYAVIKCINGRRLMVSIGHHQRRHSVVLAKKLASYLNLEYRGRKGD